MPVTADSLVQQNSGACTTSGSSVVASLPSGTTAGTTVLVVISTSTLMSTPASGFTLDLDVANGVKHVYFYRLPNVGAGVTSWTFTLAGATSFAWWVAEYTDLSLDSTLDTSASTNSSTSLVNGSTRSTGTTGANVGMNTLTLAAWGVAAGAGGNVGTWDSYTGGLTEIVDLSSTATNVNNTGLAVAGQVNTDTQGPFSSTATYTYATSTADTAFAAGMVVYLAADSRINAQALWMFGAEQGTHNGLASSITGAPQLITPAGTYTTNWLIQAASARASAYGARLIASAATVYLQVSTAIFGTTRTGATIGFNVKPVSSTGLVVLAEVAPGAGAIAQIVYDTSTTKVGARWSTATGGVVWQSSTTAAGAWVWVDVRVTGMGSATWHIDWRVEESGTVTAQSSPADLTGQTASTVAAIRFGFNGSQTATLDFDDLVMGSHPAAYPMGRHDIYAVTVDPAGTPTITGTVGNFALMTANATGAALTSGTLTTARDNIDELPPTISAASDGVLQITTAATDYIEFPMDTIALTSAQVIDGVKLLACLVSTTGAGAGTLGIRGWDGTTETVLLPTTVSSTPGSSTTVSGTVPPWVGYMWATPNRWTQAKLNAAALRFGFSSDATPDMGVHAMYLEVAVRSAETRSLFSDAATQNVDPASLAVTSVSVTGPAGGDTSLYYETSGSPTSLAVPAGTTGTATIDAPDQPTTNYIAAYWPPEGVPDA